MAIKFEKIQAGAVLFDCHKYKMGNTTVQTYGTWFVKVLEVDVEKRRALVSWNGQPAQYWSERQLKKLRAKMPEFEVSMMGQKTLKKKAKTEKGV